MEEKIRTRIAPSPTGFLHIGTARTALFNYLFAKKHRGTFVVRIEDTDRERSEKKYEDDIFTQLAWLKITADEDPLRGGPYASYRQSERTALYRKHLEELIGVGKAFYCFHSARELEEEKEKLQEAKRPALHLCEYRNMGAAEAAALREVQREFLIRFKTPGGRTIVVSDLIRGAVSFESDLIGDFSIAKDLDTPLYNFAAVVDDEEMEISHVIRGEDHLPNTPKQILVAEALGFAPPRFAHLPLILGVDRAKLSKRHAATSVAAYRAQGYLPETIANFIALLGWSPGTDQEFFSLGELIEVFSLDHVQKSGAVFDIAKLDWMNGEYIRKKSLSELTELAKPYLEDFLRASGDKSQTTNEYIEKVIALERPRLKKLSELGECVDYFFQEPSYDAELLRWKHMTGEEIIASLEESLQLLSVVPSGAARATDFEMVFLKHIGGGDKGCLLWPLRVALSGKKASPGPFEILSVLGVERAKKRINAALGNARGLL